MTDYVNSFVFSDLVEAVLLIEKQRPDHQRGRYNGIGGKIEPGETPEQAAVREIEEECGLRFSTNELVPFCRFTSTNSRIFYFSVFAAHRDFDKAATRTDEEIVVLLCSSLQTLAPARIMPNLRWQIPMALHARTPGSDGLLHRFVVTQEDCA